MKRHVVRQHLCNKEWWFIYPLVACWVCRKWEIATHCRLHGPFFPEEHLPALVQLIRRFSHYIRQALHLNSSEDLLEFVCTHHLGDEISEFNSEESEVWDA